MRRRNPTLGMIELWHRLRQRGYTRCPESLFRVMRKMGMFPAEKPKKDDELKKTNIPEEATIQKEVNGEPSENAINETINTTENSRNE